MTTRKKIIIALLAVAIFAPFVLPLQGNATAHPAVPAHSTALRQAPRTDVTTLVQTRLRSFGYSIVVDGVYGPQTTRVVKAWQKANGILVDGIAGPDTLATLGPVSFKADVAATPTTPATRQPPPETPPAEAGSVESIIRDVWPDDLEDWAVRIATRESNLQPGVRNYCCFGLFQIYFTVHRAWLAEFGVTSSDQLFDARTNAEMALVLYQRNGPGPWDL